MMRLLGIVGVVAALQGPGTLVIRTGDLSTPLPVLVTQRGPMIRLEEGLQALGAALIRDGVDRYRVVVAGSELELVVGVAVARSRTSTEPLPAAPAMFEGKLLVPLALLTDVLPRVATGFSYQSATGVLRREQAARTVRREEPVPEPRRAVARPEVGPRSGRAPAPRIVVVDAGHGGADRGMTGPSGSARKIFEKDITLGVARRLGEALQRQGVEVLMTRSTDTLIALQDRGRIANRAQATVFVSIHVNAANPRWRQPREARGFETFFLSEAKTDDERRVEEMENEVVKYESAGATEPGDPLNFIIADMKQNEYLRESSDFAAVIQHALATMPHPGPSRGVKQAGFLVLVAAHMPAVLVEVGFGTNAAEAAFLSSDAGQRRLAAAIADGTIAYLERLERKKRAGTP
ncbi:MAG: N-acetylmuramoyl-L-alanine amidase family protein [Gemmatimonadaceae bacterium]